MGWKKNVCTPNYPKLHTFVPVLTSRCTHSAFEAGVHTVATFTQLASGNWRVQVRRKTRYVAETFRRRKDGEEWALETERNIDRNGSSKPRVVQNVRTFGDLIDLHDEDMREVVAWGLSYPPSEIGEIVQPSAVEDKTPPPVMDWTKRFTSKEVV